MKLDELLLLVGAGYSKEEIETMYKSEHEKKPDSEYEKKPDSEHEKKPDSEPEKKQDFDYDKLADSIIAKMQASNRSANLDKNKNEDWLSQLSLKF